MLAFAAILALAASAAASSVVVSTPLGPVEGTRTGNVDVFRGIPYAQPPVGALRWRATEPVKAWGPNPLVANTDAPGCPQKCELPPHTCPPTVSEDCLFLNVFAPAGATNAPVMVWIHGGNFKQVSLPRCSGLPAACAPAACRPFRRPRAAEPAAAPAPPVAALATPETLPATTVPYLSRRRDTPAACCTTARAWPTRRA